MRIQVLTLLLVALVACAAASEPHHRSHASRDMSTAGELGDTEITRWPECVGMSGEEASKLIQDKYPEYKVVVVRDNAMVTMDFGFRRVRIFVNEQGKVTRTPHIG